MKVTVKYIPNDKFSSVPDEMASGRRDGYTVRGCCVLYAATVYISHRRYTLVQQHLHTTLIYI